MLIFAVFYSLPVLVAAGVSGWLGWGLGKQVLAEEAELPQWLEALAPLKGRWLRLLMMMPVILIAMAVTFLALAGSLYYLLLLALFLCYYVPILGCLMLGLLGVLCVMAFLAVRKTMQEGNAAREKARQRLPG